MQSFPRLLPEVDDLRLRLAHPGDMIHLDELIRASFSALSIGSYSESERRAALSGHMSADFHLIAGREMWVAERGGRLYACAAWTQSPSDELHKPLLKGFDVPSACIRSVFVHPCAVGQGLGRRMIRLVERLSAEAGVRRLLLVSTVNAKPVYKRLGYRELGVVRVPVTEDVELIGTMMARDLEQTTTTGTQPVYLEGAA